MNGYSRPVISPGMRRRLVESVARALCKAAGFNPDDNANSGEPCLVPGRGYLVSDNGETCWELFRHDAQIAVDELTFPDSFSVEEMAKAQEKAWTELDAEQAP